MGGIGNGPRNANLHVLPFGQAPSVHGQDGQHGQLAHIHMDVRNAANVQKRRQGELGRLVAVGGRVSTKGRKERRHDQGHRKRQKSIGAHVVQAKANATGWLGIDGGRYRDFALVLPNLHASTERES